MAVTLNPAIDVTVLARELHLGAVNRVESGGRLPGGKGVNVAAALAREGHRVSAHGFLGRENEAEFATFFDASGIADNCVRLPGATRMGIKIVDRARGETTDLNFPGLGPDDSALVELAARIDAAEATWCVLAGSLPPGVPANFYASSIRRLKVRGVRVALDTSGEALRIGLAAGPEVAKPNVHELEEIAGRRLPDTDSIVAAAKAIVAAGTGLVVVSRGAEGGCFVTADAVVLARGPMIREGSTVGAGDAMVAGIVASRLEGLSLAECARRATAYSLRALAGTGTIAGWADRVEIRRVGQSPA
ncbi:hypothetical protein IMCC26134_12165 [Verrucomicrobia bacterium IMCC26134]|nr:hypothetical protein IMCC26134_12165 [Verrucomicrobia bacterium IMCC26134]